MVDKIDILERAACYATGADRDKLHDRSRKHNVVFARYLIAVTANKKLGLSLSKSGKLVGINRSTVSHAKKVMAAMNHFGTGEEVLWWRKWKCITE